MSECRRASAAVALVEMSRSLSMVVRRGLVMEGRVAGMMNR
jgi:hypothetical protein